MERAAISLVASVVSPIFKNLGEKTASYFGGDITDDELRNLQTRILPTFQNILEIADKIPVVILKPWLMTLQDACYEAEDVIDMYEYKRIKYEVSSLPNFVKKLKKKAREYVAPITLKTELRKSMEKLQKSFDEAMQLFHVYGVNIQVKAALAREAPKEEQYETVSSTSSLVFGRDKDREFLVNMLISVADQSSITERNNVPVHAILGLGGAGKTTLAQLVYNDPKVVNHFNTRIWVHISRKFDIHNITTKIIEAIKQGGPSHVNSLDVLQSNLKELLRSKRFLVILDDVWCEDKVQWDQMLIPLNDVGDLNCRVVITARAEEVSKTLNVRHVFRLPELEPSDYWSIFKHYSVGDAEKDILEEMLKIANQIVKKLGKSPLAARMVGSLLKKNHSISFWKQILNQDMLKDTRETLYYSFQQLPLHLRRCFAICSLYSKGDGFYTYDHRSYEFGYSNNVVHLWIAQGFVEAPESNEFTLEEKGMQYFNELVSYSFFQKINDKYVIHDLLHDLAEKVSKEHCFRIESGGPITIPKTTMHLSIGHYQPPFISSILSQIFELPNLRTFLVLSSINEEETGDEFIHKVFEKLKKLRMLCFGNFRVKFEELPKSIGKLKHLRYFQLAGVKKLHESLGGLCHLIYLYFGYDVSIDKVPESLNNLINLRFFVPEGMLISIAWLKKLSHLQHCVYSINASSREQHGMHQLKHLQELQRLKIWNIRNVKNKEEASMASLKDKKFLAKLVLSWDRDTLEEVGGPSLGMNDEEVIEGLEPPPNLSDLQIDGYNGLNFPKWLLNDQHFSHLSELSIWGCSKVKQLLSLPTTLKRLEIFYCENLCEVSRFHPNLEVLDIEGCPGFEAMLSNILLFDVDQEEKEEEQKQHQQQLQPFRLKVMRINSCSSRGEKMFIFDPKAALFTSLSELTLRDLPWLTSVHLERNMPSLAEVNIDNCENLELFRCSLSLKELSITKCSMLATKQKAAAAAIKDWHFEVLRIDDPSLIAALVSSTSGNCLSSLKHLKFEEIVAIFTPEEEDLLQHLTLPSLEWLTFNNCFDLPSLPLSLHKLSSLRHLRIWNCYKIESLPNLPASLVYMEIWSCYKIESLPNLPASLVDLKIGFCPKIESLHNLPAALVDLSIEACPKIESLPNLPASLKSLKIVDPNPEFNRKYGEGGTLYHEISHIPDVRIILRG